MSLVNLNSLGDLIPVIKTEVNNTVAPKVLGNYMGIARIAQSAIRGFVNGSIPDPLVGENACQIRAVFYCEMAQDQQIMEELTTVASLLEKLDEKLAKVAIPKEQRGIIVADLVDDVPFSQKIGKIVGLILFGSILTVSKVSKLTIEKDDVSLAEMNEPKLLAGVSTGFAKDLIKISRKSLSAFSIAYLIEKGEMPQQMVLTDSLGLQSAPLVPGMKILLETIKTNQIPILLTIQLISKNIQLGRISLVFDKDLARAERIDMKRAVVVIEAVAISEESIDERDLTNKIAAIGIEKVILANSAAHPQYGGGNKHIDPPVTEERRDLRQLAIQEGFCAVNPAACRIYHIFASTLSIYTGGEK